MVVTTDSLISLFLEKMKERAELENWFIEEFTKHPDEATAKLGLIAADIDIEKLRSLKDKRHLNFYTDRFERHTLVQERGYHAAEKANPRIVEIDGKVKKIDTSGRIQLKRVHKQVGRDAKKILEEYEPMTSVYATYFENVFADQRAIAKDKAKNNNRRWHKVEDSKVDNSPVLEDVKDWRDRDGGEHHYSEDKVVAASLS